MRRLKSALLALALFSVLAAGAEAQTVLRIGYIDSQAILEQDPAAQAADEQFQADMARYRTEVQEMGEQIQGLIDDLERQQNTLSPAARANREEEIRMRQAEYSQRLSELDQQAAARQAELVQPVMERITAVIEQVRAEGNYSLIFDLAAQGIVSADPALDLTQEVIRRLQATPPPPVGGR